MKRRRPQEIAERENDDSQTPDAKHLHLRNRIRRTDNEATEYGEYRVAHKKCGVEDHEKFQLKAQNSGKEGDDASQEEGRNRGREEACGNQRKDRVVTRARIRLEEPLERDIPAIQGREHTYAHKNSVG